MGPKSPVCAHPHGSILCPMKLQNTTLSVVLWANKHFTPVFFFHAQKTKAALERKSPNYNIFSFLQNNSLFKGESLSQNSLDILSGKTSLLFYSLFLFVFFAWLLLKCLRVDALLELSCYEMTLWDKLDGSIFLSISVRLDSRRNRFFFRDILSYNQKQKVVTLANAQVYCRRFQRIEYEVFKTREACVVYPSNDRLR